MSGNGEKGGAAVAETAMVTKVWMTYSEAEIYTGLERTSIWRAVRDGRLKAGGIRGAVRFHVADLDDFMRGRCGEK